MRTNITNINFTILYIFIIFGLFIGYFSSDGIKTQNVRLVDIFLYGPILIWIAFTQIKDSSYSNFIRILLIILGTTTIAYNYKNYTRHENNL